MSCALPWQKAGFESEKDYLEYIENCKNSKRKSNSGQVNKTRSVRNQAFLDLLDAAVRSLSYDDFDETYKYKDSLIRRLEMRSEID